MVESRQSERARSLLRGQIVFNNGNSTIDCIVKNITRIGAKLVVSDVLSVPNAFELHVPQRGRNYPARLVWRDREGMGIAFDASEESTKPGDGASEHETRLRDLELQNSELRARIRVLSKRLEELGQDPNHAA